MLIILYHGVAEKVDEFEKVFQKHLPVGLFLEQIKIIKKKMRPIELKEFIEKFEKHNLEKGEVLVSFDDGYKNVIKAAEILTEFKVPAVFSIATGRVGEKNFWADKIERTIRFTKKTRLNFLGEDFDLSSEGKRIRALIKIKAIFKNFLIEENRRKTQEIWEKGGLDLEDYLLDKFRILSWRDIKELKASPLFDVIHHSHAHFPLSKFEREEDIKEDVEKCADILKEEAGIEPVVFVYPFGGKNHHDERVKRIVKEKGFKQAWSVQNKEVNYDDPFEISRVEMMKDNFNKFVNY